MKILLAIFIFTILPMFAYCGKYKITLADTSFRGINFQEVSFILDKKTNDTIRIEGLLKHVQIIEDIKCQEEVVLESNWKLKEFKLAEDHTFGKNLIPASTSVKLNVKIDKLEHYFAIRNSGVYTVHVCRFITNHEIDSIVCKSDEDIIFTQDWYLLACILGKADDVAGNVFEEDTFIRFDKEEICSYCLYDPEIQSYKCKGDNYTAKLWTGSMGVKLYPSGKLKYFQPMDDLEVQGVICKPSGSRGGVTLFENGKLKECTSAQDQTIDGVFCGKRFNLKFDETGKIVYAEKEKIFD